MTPTPALISLVGAGPGDPGLITAKGLHRLRQADVIVYDRLIDKAILKEARPDAQLIYVGKDPTPGAAAGQEDIFPLLIDKAREGKRVVRLKGGDPFVFGRGGEEAQVLAMAGIPFEIIPGVTSAIAAPAYAGIPVTHRDAASSFTVVSAVEDPAKEKSAINWQALAQTGGTLIVMMGWSALPKVVERLLKEGMKPSTPVALVEWGTYPKQRTVTATLKDIVRRGQDAGLGPPVVAVIGQVVNLRDDIAWFDNRPLSGLRVLVTRSRQQASVLCQLLAQEGADPIELPAIEIAPPQSFDALDSALRRLSQYQWVVFTSVNGVDAFFGRLHALGLDSRALGGVRLCAIGPATASALQKFGLHADLVPPEFTSNALSQSLGHAAKDSRVLLPRTDIAPLDLVQALEQSGATVDQVIAYRTLVPASSKETALRLLSSGKIDAVTFTSSSTVNNLIELLNGNSGLLAGKLITSIGPITSRTARDRGLTVDVEAPIHTVEGLVEAMKAYLARVKG
ncbi:MAG: uroporphyrinogen-III C-methyltransferase [SAR202 cluster bacterium]|nr:uroporphyrinogen-III C-methyltransferase [SAR202 cluster bacterium]